MKKVLKSILLILIVFNSKFSFSQFMAFSDTYNVSYNQSGPLGNVLANDYLNGVLLLTNPSLVSVNLIGFNPNFMLSPTGDLYYNGTETCGSITLTYQLIDIAGIQPPTTVSISGIKSGLIPQNDTYTVNNGETTNIGLLTVNDWICGLPTGEGITVFATPSGITYNQVTGDLTVSSSVSPGIYTFSYQRQTNSFSVLPSPMATVTINVISSFAFTATGTYFDGNSDGFTNVGDVINYQFTIENVSTSSITNVNVTSTSVPIIGSPIANLAIGAIDNTTFSAIYVLTETDINLGAVSHSFMVSGLNDLLLLQTKNATSTNSLGISDGIKMIAFVDLNSNNIKDLGETNLEFGQFQFEKNSDGIIHNLIDPTGSFIIYETNPTNSYSLSYSIYPSLSSVYSPIIASYSTVLVPTGSGVTDFYFPVVEIPFEDLAVSIVSISGPVPGFSYQNLIKFSNNGTETIPFGTVTFNHDPNLTINPVIGSSPILNGFTFDFMNLTPHEQRTIIVTVNTPTIPFVALGDLVTNSVSITETIGDIQPLNNNYSLVQLITGSYDPNDKLEINGERIDFESFSSSDYLTYTIRFENTGSGNAINIEVVDTLDLLLDVTSVQMVDASNDYSLDRIGNVLSWKFNGINLEPSISDTSLIGKGYITFKVKPNLGLVAGDTISNTANIYFDFNPAITTNTCYSIFYSSASINEESQFDLTVFPNPTNDIIHIYSESLILSLEIIDINGKTILKEESTNQNSTEFNIQQLNPGVYQLKVLTENGMVIEKVIKK